MIIKQTNTASVSDPMTYKFFDIFKQCKNWRQFARLILITDFAMLAFFCRNSAFITHTGQSTILLNYGISVPIVKSSNDEWKALRLMQ